MDILAQYLGKDCEFYKTVWELIFQRCSGVIVTRLNSEEEVWGSRPCGIVELCSWVKNLYFLSASLHPGVYCEGGVIILLVTTCNENQDKLRLGHLAWVQTYTVYCNVEHTRMQWRLGSFENKFECDFIASFEIGFSYNGHLTDDKLKHKLSNHQWDQFCFVELFFRWGYCSWFKWIRCCGIKPSRHVKRNVGKPVCPCGAAPASQS